MSKVNDIISRIITIIQWCGNNRTNTVVNVLTEQIPTKHTVFLIQTILKEVIDLNQSILDRSIGRMEREIKHVSSIQHSSHTNQSRIKIIQFSGLTAATFIGFDITIECRNHDFLRNEYFILFRLTNKITTFG